MRIHGLDKVEDNTRKKCQINKQVDYWDSVAASKKFTHPFRFDKFEMYTSKTATILDYGCGYGRVMNELYKKNYHNVIGLDFSTRFVFKGQRLFPHLNIQLNEKNTISYPDNYFDAVILFAVLTCIAEDISQKNLIKEIHRVLKLGGIIYISDYLIQNNKKNKDSYNKYGEKYGCYGVFELPDGAILRHHTEEYIENLTSAFDPIWQQNIEVTTMNGNRSIAYQYIGKS